MRRLRSDPGCRSIASFITASLAFLLCATLNLGAQQASPPAPSSSSAQEPATEMAVKDQSTSSNIEEAAKLRVNVRLVMARVVVRDGTGHAVGGLHKEDFEIFDNGKKQVISNFDVENTSTPVAAVDHNEVKAGQGETQAPVSPVPFPTRYVAYVFDDLRLNFGDMVHVRDATERRLNQLLPAERVGIFSTSRQSVLDFTDDRAQMHQVLNGLKPSSREPQEVSKCPDISLYMADLIINKQDAEVLQTAVNEYIACANIQGRTDWVPSFIRSLSSQILNLGQEDSRMALRVMTDLVRRMSALPGRRDIVLVSPGFLTPQLEYDYGELIDRAVRAQVIISSLDARGLYTIVPFGDASKKGNPDFSIGGQSWGHASHALLEINSARAESDILAVLANNTGGVFFQNNNDMDAGFRRVAESPEFYYVLGFTPQNLKSDGHYHSLKVSLTNHQKYDIQARRGYYAPRHDMDSTEEAKREIEDEVFSSEELHDLPVALHTEFFKPSNDSAKLTVLARVDVKRLRYKQSNDRNLNDLTVVTAVFDRNGNFVKADQKLVQMRWKTETLEAKLTSGITLKASFDVKPGHYLVRVVARDAEQQVMSAENGAVEIP